MSEATNTPSDNLRDPLPPPWIRYPDIGRYSIGWRMGFGESYICVWVPWYSALSVSERLRYQEMFPAEGEWAGYWIETDE